MLDIQLKEFEMNNLNLILDLDSFLNNKLIVEKNVSFSIKIDSVQSFRKLNYFQFFEPNIINHFSFLFNKNVLNDFNEDDIYFLMSFIFHPYFLKISNKPILFAYEILENESLEKLKEKIVKQGFSDCIIKTTHLELNKLDVRNQYLSILNDQFIVNSFLHILITSPNEIETSISKFFEAENEFKENEPKLFEIFLKIYEQENELIKLKLELVETKEDLDNQKIYLEFFKNKDEAKKINDFYYHEYEVLPLWYKQLGHIIKVILGKRTLKSLWDNNSKNNLY